MPNPSSLGNVIIDFAASYGVYGLSIGMFAESFGIPYGSAVLVLLAGSLIKAGKTTYLEAVLLSTLGLTLGSLFSYLLGYIGKKMGKAIILRRRPCQDKPPSRVKRFITRYGYISIFLAQLFGTTRTFISIPAGAMELDLLWFTIFTALGGFIFCAATIGFSVVMTELLGRILSFLYTIPYFPLWILLLAIAIFLLVKKIWNWLPWLKEPVFFEDDDCKKQTEKDYY